MYVSVHNLWCACLQDDEVAEAEDTEGPGCLGHARDDDDELCCLKDSTETFVKIFDSRMLWFIVFIHY